MKYSLVSFSLSIEDKYEWLEINNFINFFDEQNIILFLNGYDINLERFKRIGWKYNNIILTYIKPNYYSIRNKNLRIFFWRIRKKSR